MVYITTPSLSDRRRVLETSIVNFIQKLNTKREFHEPADKSIKINNFGKKLLSRCNGELISHAINLPTGQLITSSIAYVMETNFTNLTTNVSDAEVWKLKFEQEQNKTRELSEKVSNAAITITKLKQQIKTLEGQSN